MVASLRSWLCIASGSRACRWSLPRPCVQVLLHSAVDNWQEVCRIDDCASNELRKFSPAPHEQFAAVPDHLLTDAWSGYTQVDKVNWAPRCKGDFANQLHRPVHVQFMLCQYGDINVAFAVGLTGSN